MDFIQKTHENTLGFELQVLVFFHLYATGDQDILKKIKKSVASRKTQYNITDKTAWLASP